ncbi:MAG: hypothetical protein KBH51_00660 [Synergistales bacterium]|nr:hypothetical protein [Synergistales bacterium]
MKRSLKVQFMVMVFVAVALMVSVAFAQNGSLETYISINPLFVDGKLVEDNVVYVDSVYLEGTVASDTGIVSLRWRSDRGGGGNVQLFIGKFGETNLNGKWRIPKVPLAMGANTITIEAKSVNGKLFSKQVTIYRR